MISTKSVLEHFFGEALLLQMAVQRTVSLGVFSVVAAVEFPVGVADEFPVGVVFEG